LGKDFLEAIMANDVIKKPRGTLDYFYQDDRLLSGLRTELMDLSESFGCNPCDPPIFEENRLFHRTTGESSDIVRKETFDLASKGEKDYTLRPEFTAGVNRAIVENKYYTLPDMPLRLSYFGPVFRYERPQAGRLRQFNQYGVEFVDQKIDLDTSVDCFLLSIRASEEALKRPVMAKINFLGSLASRENYKKQLALYFAPKIDTMCDDCKRRLAINPLRLLDCKVPQDQEIAKGAPKIQDYLTEEDKAEFGKLQSALATLGVDVSIDDGLVRGLDYYTGLVWEIYDKEHLDLGAIGGGGKYDNLMSEIGGPAFEGIGFSLGVERLLLSLSDEEKARLGAIKPLDVFVIDNRKDGKVMGLVNLLRKNGKSVSICSFARGMGGAFKMADRLKARYVLLSEEDGTYQLKDMASRTQNIVTPEEIVSLVK
jgi:histidyl-tRNA synthetase